MPRVLITGVSGFVGQHLTRELKNRNYSVVGVGLEAKPHISIEKLLDNYTSCDLTSYKEVKKLPLNNVDAIISLAGLAKVGPSFDNPDQYKQINVSVLTVIARYVLERGLKIKVLAISTGAVYEANQPMPLTEDSSLISSGSPYAESKILMEDEIKKLRGAGLNCTIARPFNHIGPGQESGFLVPDLSEKIKQSLETNEPVLTGDLQTKRDYTDVRDVVRAYADLISKPKLKYDLYNVCSGRSISGKKMLDLLLEAHGAVGKVETTVDQKLIRPDDPLDINGNFDRLREETGWAPKIKLKQTISDFVHSKAQ